MYLEGSDQHRGWFHSSLLESCGTRGRAPFDVVLTHGFVLDERGREDVEVARQRRRPRRTSSSSRGADILRLWVAASDYADDLRIGKEILKTFVETYRKLRNTRPLDAGHARPLPRGRPRSRRTRCRSWSASILHRLAELDVEIREAYAAFDYKRVVALLNGFMTGDLSAFYFDIRKDALYCDPISSLTRRSALTVIEETFRRAVVWLAPILAFTAEEAWLARHPANDGLGASRDLSRDAAEMARR